MRSSSLTAEQVSFCRSSGTAVRRAAGTPKMTSAARTLSRARSRERRIQLFGANRIVIAAHFDLDGLAQGCGGLDQRDNLGAHVFQQEALFGRDLGAAGHEAKSALLQLRPLIPPAGAVRRSAEPANDIPPSGTRRCWVTRLAGKSDRGIGCQRIAQARDVESRAALFGVSEYDARLAFQAMREIRRSGARWRRYKSTSRRGPIASSAGSPNRSARAPQEVERRLVRFALAEQAGLRVAGGSYRTARYRRRKCGELRLSSVRWRPECPETPGSACVGATPRTKPARIASGP